MSVNGVTNATAAYTNTSTAQAAPKKAEQAATEKDTAKDTGVVYEKSALNIKTLHILYLIFYFIILKLK